MQGFKILCGLLSLFVLGMWGWTLLRLLAASLAVVAN